MGVFINEAADPVSYRVLEVEMETRLDWEDGLQTKLFNIFHYHYASGSGAVDLQSFIDNFQTLVVSQIAPLLNVRVINVRSRVRPLDDPLVPSVEQSSGLYNGAVTGDPLSTSLAAVVQFLSDARGRSFRGSKHFGGLSESDTDGGDELSTTTIGNWATALTQLAANMTDSGSYTYNPCVLSGTLSNVLGTPPSFTGATVSSVSLNHIIGTMRRRKERTGT